MAIGTCEKNCGCVEKCRMGMFTQTEFNSVMKDQNSTWNVFAHAAEFDVEEVNGQIKLLTIRRMDANETHYMLPDEEDLHELTSNCRCRPNSINVSSNPEDGYAITHRKLKEQ